MKNTILVGSAALVLAVAGNALADPSRTTGCDDVYDPNNACASAREMGVGTYPGLGIALFPSDDDWYKIAVQRNGTVNIDLAFTHANGDIDMRLFNLCGGTQVAVSQGTTNTEHISYKNTGNSRFYYLRVSMISGSCNSYSMTIGITSADNAVATYTPAGWDFPVVPKDVNNSTFGSAHLNFLIGDANTWINAATNITGPDNFPAFDSAVFVDDSLTQNYNFSENSAPGVWFAINSGPYPIRGGRHTVRHQADIGDDFVETNENDNEWSNQWIWSPLVTAYAVPHVRRFPPLKGGGIHANADGMSYVRQGSVAWVVAEAPLTPGDDYDLRVYSDYANLSSGYSNLIGSSAVSTNGTDFVVGHYSGTPTTIYFAVDRFLASQGNDFALDQTDARNRNGNLETTPSFSWTPISLAANRVADVFEARMTEGLTYYFTVRQLSGTTPLGFRIFPATAGGIYGATAGTASSGAGSLQKLTFVAAATGWHPIVVYRKTGTNIGTPTTYDFEWSTTGLVDVPEHGAEARLTLAEPAPNPIHDRGRLTYALPAAGRVGLGIYDVNGRLVRELVDEWQSAGEHSVDWEGTRSDGGRSAAGVYWARLRFADRTLSRRLALLP